MASKRVAVIGSGYVGTVVAACLAHVGHQVTGVEADKAKLASLRAGRAPFHETGLDDLLAEGLANHRLCFRPDIPGAMETCDIIFIAVGTPPTPSGEPDMSAMTAVARTIAPHVRNHILVNKSTVPVGAGRWLASLIEEEAPTRHRRDRVRVVSNPEFLREGSAVHDYMYPDRIVLGAEDPLALDEVIAVYQPIINGVSGARVEPVPVVRTDLVTAELLKYACNAFLATKISFANELARMCQFLGADIGEVTTGMGLDTRIGAAFLQAGVGWGGSCFGKDTAALIATARNYNYRARILESAVAVNDDQRGLIVDTLLNHLHTLRGARIALLGLAFKAGTDDLRDSPALDIAARLHAQGCFVAAYDPMVRHLPDHPSVRVADNPYVASRHADAVIVATDWAEFRHIDLDRLAVEAPAALLIDGRNLLDPAAAVRAGFAYHGIGRRPLSAPAAAEERSAVPAGLAARPAEGAA